MALLTKKDKEKEKVYELCEEAKVAFKKRGVILLHLYVNPVSTLLQILISNDVAYLVQYYSMASNNNELLEAFAYPIAILIFVLFLIVVYVMYTNYESTWLNTFSWIMESFLTMTCANFIIQIFQTLFTPGTGEYLQWAWIITSGIGFMAAGIWYLLDYFHHEHAAKIQLKHTLEHTDHVAIEYMERIRAIVHEYSRQQAKELNLDILLRFPVDKNDTFIGMLSEYHQLSTTSAGKE